MGLSAEAHSTNWLEFFDCKSRTATYIYVKHRLHYDTDILLPKEYQRHKAAKSLEMLTSREAMLPLNMVAAVKYRLQNRVRTRGIRGHRHQPVAWVTSDK